MKRIKIAYDENLLWRQGQVDNDRLFYLWRKIQQAVNNQVTWSVAFSVAVEEELNEARQI